jgi:hypothetical protein
LDFNLGFVSRPRLLSIFLPEMTTEELLSSTTKQVPLGVVNIIQDYCVCHSKIANEMESRGEVITSIQQHIFAAEFYFSQDNQSVEFPSLKSREEIGKSVCRTALAYWHGINDLVRIDCQKASKYARIAKTIFGYNSIQDYLSSTPLELKTEMNPFIYSIYDSYQTLSTRNFYLNLDKENHLWFQNPLFKREDSNTKAYVDSFVDKLFSLRKMGIIRATSMFINVFLRRRGCQESMIKYLVEFTRLEGKMTDEHDVFVMTNENGVEFSTISRSEFLYTKDADIINIADEKCVGKIVGDRYDHNLLHLYQLVMKFSPMNYNDAITCLEKAEKYGNMSAITEVCNVIRKSKPCKFVDAEIKTDNWKGVVEYLTKCLTTCNKNKILPLRTKLYKLYGSPGIVDGKKVAIIDGKKALYWHALQFEDGLR